MAGNIQAFRDSFKSELARPNKFDVDIPIRPELLSSLLDRGFESKITNQVLSLRCENAELPGRTFATTEQKIYGPTEKFPYHVSYNDLNLTFIVNDDMQVKSFFDGWMNYINPNNTYNFKYKEEYATDISIRQYDLTNTLSYDVLLEQAYPVSINQLDLDWSADGHHKLVVTFVYKSWKNTQERVRIANPNMDLGI